MMTLEHHHVRMTGLKNPNYEYVRAKELKIVRMRNELF